MFQIISVPPLSLIFIYILPIEDEEQVGQLSEQIVQEPASRFNFSFSCKFAVFSAGFSILFPSSLEIGGQSWVESSFKPCWLVFFKSYMFQIFFSIHGSSI